MIRPATLYHVTIDTGDVRESPRAEVSAVALNVCKNFIAEALDAQAPEPVDGFRFYATKHKDVLACAVEGDRGNVVKYWCARAPAPHRWRAISKDNEPPAPWCAVQIGTAAILHPDALSWVGDFERCIAWAWSES